MGFKELFKKLMDRNETNQTELAKYVGYTPQTVSKWYTGKTEPDSKTLKKIANYFNVSTDYLLGNNESVDTIDEEQKEIDMLCKLLIKNGFMKENEDLTNKELDKLMKFVSANKEFLKDSK